MRCPACGGLNTDTATYCRSCGRDLAVRPTQNQKSFLPPSQPSAPRSPYPLPPSPQQQSRPPYQPAAGQVRGPAQNPAPQNVAQSRRRASNAPVAPLQPVTPVVPNPSSTSPEPPAPFPPQTVANVQALAESALTYSLLSDDEIYGRKRVVRVGYRRCLAWQQVATLYKVLQECKEDRVEKFDTVIVQGFFDPNENLYNFTNGQITYDRGVRLGSQTLNRYQIETGNGFSSDSIRIVLSEAAR